MISNATADICSFDSLTLGHRTQLPHGPVARVLWSTGAGADVMKRIAAPMVRGLASSLVLQLTLYPALYALWKGRGAMMEYGRDPQ